MFGLANKILKTVSGMEVDRTPGTVGVLLCLCLAYIVIFCTLVSCYLSSSSYGESSDAHCRCRSSGQCVHRQHHHRLHQPPRAQRNADRRLQHRRLPAPQRHLDFHTGGSRRGQLVPQRHVTRRYCCTCRKRHAWDKRYHKQRHRWGLCQVIVLGQYHWVIGNYSQDTLESASS